MQWLTQPITGHLIQTAEHSHRVFIVQEEPGEAKVNHGENMQIPTQAGSGLKERGQHYPLQQHSILYHGQDQDGSRAYSGNTGLKWTKDIPVHCRIPYTHSEQQVAGS